MNDSSEKAMGILCYIPFMVLIPAIMGGSPFVKHHANQGLVLFILELILGAVTAICGSVLKVIPVLGGVVTGVISGVVGLVTLIFIILGIVQVLNGDTRDLPVIGMFKILK